MSLISALLGVDLPIIQAPMAGVQDEALAIAVSEAGGLGSMPCALLTPAQLEAALRSFAGLPRPINLNFFCHAMAEPDPTQEQRWRQALTPYYHEFAVAPPASRGVQGMVLAGDRMPASRKRSDHRPASSQVSLRLVLTVHPT